MSGIIKLLPDAVANQIAAGEVVQRPANAVKELLENSLDAKATSISLLIRDGGITSIQVVDNGKGMSEFDARLCWERHATSKIRKAEDLFALDTYGFRGEAMASIAAVAQVEMKTKRKDDEVAQFIRIEASEVLEQRVDAAPDGTSITIKNLFYNIPARRNFLKSISVETKHIVEEFVRQAMANPQVEFAFYNNQQEVYRFPIQTLKDRLLATLNRKSPSDLLEIQEDTELVRISGYSGIPNLSKKTRGDQYFFVNGRFIRSPYFHHAVQAAYEGLIETDHHATYAIYLELDPAKVDVNVHPTKTEVKFEDEKHIYNIIKASVRKSLGGFVIQPDLGLGDTINQDHWQQLTDFKPGNNPLWNKGLDKPFGNDLGHNNSVGSGGSLGNQNRGFETRRDSSGNGDFGSLGGGFNKPNSDGQKSSYNPFNTPEQGAYRRNHGSDWQKVLGSVDLVNQTVQSNWENENQTAGNQENALFQEDKDLQITPGFAWGDKYWVVLINQKLTIVHVQFAQQHWMFNQYLQSLDTRKGVTQSLLFPRMVELSPAHLTLALDLLPELGSLGFDINHFGGNSLIINGMPSQLTQGDEQKLLEQILDDFAQTQGDLKLGKHQSMALTMSRYASRRGSNQISPEEIKHLVAQIMQLPEPGITFDGKVVFMEITLPQLFDHFNKGRRL